MFLIHFICYKCIKIQFQFLEVDSTDAVIGLLEENINDLPKDLKCVKESSFLLNRNGRIYIDGDEKATIMPEFIRGLKVSQHIFL